MPQPIDIETEPWYTAPKDVEWDDSPSASTRSRVSLNLNTITQNAVTMAARDEDPTDMLVEEAKKAATITGGKVNRSIYKNVYSQLFSGFTDADDRRIQEKEAGEQLAKQYRIEGATPMFSGLAKTFETTDPDQVYVMNIEKQYRKLYQIPENMQLDPRHITAGDYGRIATALMAQQIDLSKDVMDPDVLAGIQDAMQMMQSDEAQFVPKSFRDAYQSILTSVTKAITQRQTEMYQLDEMERTKQREDEVRRKLERNEMVIQMGQETAAAYNKEAVSDPWRRTLNVAPVVRVGNVKRFCANEHVRDLIERFPEAERQEVINELQPSETFGIIGGDEEKFQAIKVQKFALERPVDRSQLEDLKAEGLQRLQYDVAMARTAEGQYPLFREVFTTPEISDASLNILTGDHAKEFGAFLGKLITKITPANKSAGEQAKGFDLETWWPECIKSSPMFAPILNRQLKNPTLGSAIRTLIGTGDPRKIQMGLQIALAADQIHTMEGVSGYVAGGASTIQKVLGTYFEEDPSLSPRKNIDRMVDALTTSKDRDTADGQKALITTWNIMQQWIYTLESFKEKDLAAGSPVYQPMLSTHKVAGTDYTFDELLADLKRKSLEIDIFVRWQARFTSAAHRPETWTELGRELFRRASPGGAMGAAGAEWVINKAKKWSSGE